jgi:hypothetical protein
VRCTPLSRINFGGNKVAERVRADPISEPAREARPHLGTTDMRKFQPALAPALLDGFLDDARCRGAAARGSQGPQRRAPECELIHLQNPRGGKDDRLRTLAAEEGIRAREIAQPVRQPGRHLRLAGISQLQQDVAQAFRRVGVPGQAPREGFHKDPPRAGPSSGTGQHPQGTSHGLRRSWLCTRRLGKAHTRQETT